MGWFGEKAKRHPKRKENNLCTTRPALLVKITSIILLRMAFVKPKFYSLISEKCSHLWEPVDEKLPVRGGHPPPGVADGCC